jgi:hypothetical protein
MCDAIFIDLKLYFKGGVVGIIPTEIKGLSLE